MEEQEREEGNLPEEAAAAATSAVAVSSPSSVERPHQRKSTAEAAPLSPPPSPPQVSSLQGRDDTREKSPPKEILTTRSTKTMDRNERMTAAGPPQRPRKRSSDDDGSFLSNSSDELFEDEPDKSFPKVSPNRLAARMERRKLSRKQKHLVDDSKEGSSLSRVGLPSLRAFRKEEKREKDDDESSHWSSSDGEHGEEALRNVRWLSQDDIEICRRLDEEYERALEEREVVYTARYNSVRQSACFSVVFMLVYLSLGTIFFIRQEPEWTVSDSLLFSIYTITTVGCKCIALFVFR